MNDVQPPPGSFTEGRKDDPIGLFNNIGKKLDTTGGSMSHIVLKKKGSKWVIHNKNTDKDEASGSDHEKMESKAKEQDEKEDKEIETGAKDEHKEHPEFSKKTAKQIAKDHIGIDKGYYLKSNHVKHEDMGKGGGKGEGKVEKVMHEYKEGELHSGNKHGPEVTNHKQAVAIALSEQRKGKK